MSRTSALSVAALFAMLAILFAVQGNLPAMAGESMPNVTGKWEGSWNHRIGSGQVTFQLVQEGSKVIGKQSVVGVMPVYGTQQAQQLVIGEEVRDGVLDGSTLMFHVVAENVKGQLNFTLTVSGDTMTGTACGDTCATLKLKKAKV
jgi:hypothetical protein